LAPLLTAAALDGFTPADDAALLFVLTFFFVYF